MALGTEDGGILLIDWDILTAALQPWEAGTLRICLFKAGSRVACRLSQSPSLAVPFGIFCKIKIAPSETTQDKRSKNCYITSMTTVTEIEKAIEKLPREEYGQLRGWIENYELERELVKSSADVIALLDEEDGGGSQLTRE